MEGVFVFVMPEEDYFNPPNRLRYLGIFAFSHRWWRILLYYTKTLAP